jgi:hypothetical protein
VIIARQASVAILTGTADREDQATIQTRSLTCGASGFNEAAGQVPELDAAPGDRPLVQEKVELLQVQRGRQGSTGRLSLLKL